MVVEPPTSGEVEARTLRELGESGVLSLVMLAVEQEVPRPTEQVVTFRIRRTGHPETGGMVITGFTDDQRHITIATQKDGDQPALATIVST